MPTLKLTKTNIDGIQTGRGKQIDYFDTDIKGFGLRVNATSKTFFVFSRINGKQSRVTIGRYGVMTPDEARKEAKSKLVQMSNGVDLNKEKAANCKRGMTLKEAYDEYLAIRKPKMHTIRVDRSLLNKHLSDWLNKPITEITKEMVSRRHLLLSSKSGNHTANNTFRLFRRIYNCASAMVDDSLPVNPVKRLSDAKQWAKVGRRHTIIKDSDLPAWFEAVNSLEDIFMKNYLKLQLFTGLRKGEGLALRWNDVDMKNKTFTIPETKNGRALTLPMSNFIYMLFIELQENRLSEYVFPARTKNSKTGHMAEPKRQVVKVKSAANVSFCLHDLRRTFKTAAQDTVTTAENHALTNHTSRDAGDGYIILSTDKLRTPMQKITDKILALAHQKQPAKILHLHGMTG